MFRSEAALICLGGYEAGVPRTTQVLTVAGIGRYTVYTKETHMAKVKSIGVREFRNNASTYLSGSETIAVNRHGKVIGFYIPLERDEDEVRRAVARLGAAVGQVLEETGMTEEELARVFDLRQPMPE